MVDSISLMAKVPWALKQITTDWYQATIFYSLLGFVTLIMYKKIKKILNTADVIE